MAAVFILLIAAALVAAAFGLRRAALRERLARRDLLADCAALLENPRIEPDEAGYGVLRGRYSGRDVALRPFADTLTFRRLPQLWLAATVRAEGDGGPTVEIMRRPTGMEFYAAGDRLPARFATPAGWPADAAVRGSADASALLAALAAPLAGHFEDPRLKSVLIGPRGVRAIRQAAEGARGAYLLFRDARFGADRVPVAEAEAALAAAFSAADAATEGDEHGHALDQAAA